MADTQQAYCVKCREKREIKDPQSVTMKNGRPATKGTCPVCGTALFRIGAGGGSGGGNGGGDGGGKSEGGSKSGGSKSGGRSKSKSGSSGNS